VDHRVPVAGRREAREIRALGGLTCLVGSRVLASERTWMGRISSSTVLEMQQAGQQGAVDVLELVGEMDVPVVAPQGGDPA